MIEERIDVVLSDKVSDGPATKFREMADAAELAYRHVNALKTSMKSFDAAGIRKTQSEMVKMTVQSNRQASSNESLRAATARADAAVARLGVTQEKLTRQQTQTNVVAERLNTQIERTGLIAARTDRVKQQTILTSERVTRSQDKENDSAVALFRTQQKLDAQNAKQASRAGRAVEMSLLGISNNQMNAQGRSDDRAALRESKEMARMTREADALRASLDPLTAAKQNFNNSVAQASKLLAAGAISQDTFNAAQKRAHATYEQSAKGIGSVGNAAKLTKFQVLTMQYTINDVVASLASGANPMTILLQQGGQVTQAWGGLIPTLKAAGGAIFTLTGGIVALVAAGVGMTLFVDNAEKELKGLQRQLDLTNGSAGMTASGFLDMSAQIATATKTSVSSTRDIAAAYAGTGQIGATQIQQLTQVTQNWAKLSGESTDDVTKRFSKLIDQPAKFAKEFNTQYNIMTPTQVAHIRRLEEEGLKTEAVTALSRILFDYYGNEAPKKLGLLTGAWDRLGVSVSNALSEMRKAFREQTSAEKVANAQAKIVELTAQKDTAAGRLGFVQTGIATQLREQEQIIANEREIQRMENRTAEEKARSARETREATEAEEQLGKRSAEVADNAVKARQEIAKFRNELVQSAKKFSTDPTAENYSSKLADSVKNQKAIEAGINKKYMPDANKTPKKGRADHSQENYADSVEKATAELNKELKSQQMVDKEREKSRKMDDIEIQFIRSKIPLREKDRAALSALVDKMVEGRDVQQAIVQSYEQANAPAREFAAAQAAIAINFAKGRIDAATVRAQVEQITDRYESQTDVLYGLKKELEAQAVARGKVGDAVEIESRMYQLEQEALRAGKPLRDEELKWAREKLAVSIEQAKVDAERRRIFDSSRGEQQKNFDRTTGAAAGMAGAGQISQADALRTAQSSSSIPGLYSEGTNEAAKLNEDRHAQMYAELDRLRQLDLVSEQTYQAAKVKIALSAQQAQLNYAGQFFSDLSGLQKSENKKIAAIGKAAAISQAIIETYKSATSAYAAMAGIPYVGPALGVAAAAGAIAAGMANVQQIRAQPTGGGFREGGYTGDGPRGAVAGYVHGQEYVMNADATSRHRGALERMNRGYAPPGGDSGATGPAGGAAGASGGGSSADMGRVRIVNVLSPQIVGDFLATDRGEQLIMNVLSNNSDRVQAITNQK